MVAQQAATHWALVVMADELRLVTKGHVCPLNDVEFKHAAPGTPKCALGGGAEMFEVSAHPRASASDASMPPWMHLAALVSRAAQTNLPVLNK